MLAVEPLREALREVIDPEVGLDIITLGLVYEINPGEDNSVAVRMTMTSRGCPMTGVITSSTRSVLEAQPEVGEVSVDVVWEPAWSPEKIEPEGRKLLGI